ncbi:MAG: hydroxymethylbilane synthase [Chloroflexi bacterium]|nr:hydroxymethylbilane synthase [Chloroflexota bacterium]
MSTLRIGTRASRLALIQTELVAARLRKAWPELAVEPVEITTAGDRDRTSPLTSGEGAGWFTSAIQDALLAGEVDVAVHSYKDLPTARPDGLVIAAVPERADPRDALVSREGATLAGLPAGAVVGTSSPRRSAQTLAVRPDLELRPIRGNVDTRLEKVDSGEYDAALFAIAGLERLGLADRASHLFGFEEMLPAPAQGALAVECRREDVETQRLLAAIDDTDLRRRVSAERAFLAALEAGCSYPAAAYAESFGTTLKLHGLVAPEGVIVRSKVGGPVKAGPGLGRALARELLEIAEQRGV